MLIDAKACEDHGIDVHLQCTGLNGLNGREFHGWCYDDNPRKNTTSYAVRMLKVMIKLHIPMNTAHYVREDFEQRN